MDQKQERKYSKRIRKGRGGMWGSETRWASYVTEIDRTRVAHTRGKRRRKSSAIKSRYTAKPKPGGQASSPTHVSVLSHAEITKRG